MGSGVVAIRQEHPTVYPYICRSEVMEKLIRKGQFVFGIAIAAFGVENFFCARLGLEVRGVPWFPINPLWGYLIGVVLLAAGLSIMANIGVRLTSILLGILFLLLDLFVELP